MPDHKTVTFDASQWQLVPKVPTEEMHVAAVRATVRCTGNDDFPPRVWRAMLAAAPTPAAQSAGQEAIYQARTGASEWADVSRLQFESIKLDKRIVYAAPVNASEQNARQGAEACSHCGAESAKGCIEDRYCPLANAAPVNGGERETYEPYSAADFTKLVAENAGLKLNVRRLEKQLLELNEELHVADLVSAADAQQVGICSDCGSASPVDCSGRGCFAHEEERAADAPKMRAGYGETDFGYTFVGVTLEEGDKRLMALLVSALGTEHAAIDDMTNLIFRSRALTSPAKVGGDGREAFESAMRAKGKSVARAAEEYGGKYRFVEPQWEGWQARAALSADAREAPLDIEVRAFLENLAKANSEPLNSVAAYKDRASRIDCMLNIRNHARALLARAALSADGGDAIGQKKAAFLKHEGAVETGVMLRAENRIALVTYQGRVEWYDANEFGGIQLSAEGGDKRAYPDELTDDMREVLGWLCYQCAPYAHAFRKAGASIKTRAEDEQAFVLHWLVKLVLDHPDDWRKVGAEQAKVAIDAADQAKGDAS